MTVPGREASIVAQFVDRNRGVTYTVVKLLGRFVIRLNDNLNQVRTYLAPSEAVATRYYVGLLEGVKASGHEIQVTVPLEDTEETAVARGIPSFHDTPGATMVTKVTCQVCGSNNVDLNPDATKTCLNCHRTERMHVRSPHFGTPVFVPAQGRKPPFAPAVGWAETFTFVDDPRKFSDHEHFWNPAEGKLGKLGKGTDAEGKRRMGGAYRCELCERRMNVELVEGGSQASVYPPDTFLHTCGRCSKTFRDGHPFSEFRWIGYPFCSAACMDAVRAAQNEKELRHLIPTLELMVRNATDDGARARARERLEVIVTDEPEPLAPLAREALSRLNRNREPAR